MIPRSFKSKFAKLEYSGEKLKVSCVTNDWHFGDFDETWYFHFKNISSIAEIHELNDVFKEKVK